MAWDTASVSLYVLHDDRKRTHKTADYYYSGFGELQVLLCYQTPEMAQGQKEPSHQIKEVHFDEALDLAKKEKVSAALIVEKLQGEKLIGRVVFVN